MNMPSDDVSSLHDIAQETYASLLKTIFDDYSCIHFVPSGLNARSRRQTDESFKPEAHIAQLHWHNHVVKRLLPVHYNNFRLGDLRMIVIGSRPFANYNETLGVAAEKGVFCPSSSDGQVPTEVKQLIQLLDEAFALLERNSQTNPHTQLHSDNRPSYDYYCQLSKQHTLFINACPFLKSTVTEEIEYRVAIGSISFLNDILKNRLKNGHKLAVLDLRTSCHMHVDDLLVVPDYVMPTISICDAHYQTDPTFKLNYDGHHYIRLGKKTPSAQERNYMLMELIKGKRFGIDRLFRKESVQYTSDQRLSLSEQVNKRLDALVESFSYQASLEEAGESGQPVVRMQGAVRLQPYSVEPYQMSQIAVNQQVRIAHQQIRIDNRQQIQFQGSASQPDNYPVGIGSYSFNLGIFMESPGYIETERQIEQTEFVCRLLFEKFYQKRLERSQSPHHGIKRNVHSLLLLLTFALRHKWSVSYVDWKDRQKFLNLLSQPTFEYFNFKPSSIERNLLVSRVGKKYILLLFSAEAPNQMLIFSNYEHFAESDFAKILLIQHVTLSRALMLSIHEHDSRTEFLDISIEYNTLERCWLLSQKNKIEQLMMKHKIADDIKQPVNARKPIDDKNAEQKLNLHTAPVLNEKRQKALKELMGDLRNIAHKTRPDICASVEILYKHMENPCEKLEKLANGIAMYLNQTKGCRLKVKPKGFESCHTDGSTHHSEPKLPDSTKAHQTKSPKDKTPGNNNNNNQKPKPEPKQTPSSAQKSNKSKVILHDLNDVGSDDQGSYQRAEITVEKPYINCSQTGFCLRSHDCITYWDSEPVDIEGVSESDTTLVELIGAAVCAMELYIQRELIEEMGCRDPSEQCRPELFMDSQNVLNEVNDKLGHMFERGEVRSMTKRDRTVADSVAKRDQTGAPYTAKIALPQLDEHLHSLLYLVGVKEIEHTYVPTRFNPADYLTKLNIGPDFAEVRKCFNLFDE